MSNNIAIYYHPEGFDTSSAKLMGRHAAGEGFLRAWAQHCDAARLVCLADTQGAAEHFKRTVTGHGWTGSVAHVPRERLELLGEVGSLLLPGPGLADYAWRRRGTNQRGYSILGLTHTTASANAMDSIVDLLSAPVQPWDALICTSQSVRAMVIDLLSTQAQYLSERFGVPAERQWVTPQLPVIPLGVDTDALRPDAGARAVWRQKLGIAEHDRVVLFVGRLSFHAKAHPVAMYQALERARQAAPGRVHLIESGWFANRFIEEAYASMAAAHCPGVVRHVLDGRDRAVRHSIWHAADIFCSLSDNIQETFGLTPIEAMAAGLPSIVSDWDGYKETVRDGIDGFRVESWMPTPPLGEDLARRHAAGIDNYDNYCGQACQFVAVNVDAAAAAFRRLLSDDDLRRRMGNAAREHAVGRFDWRHVVRQYQTLAGELFQIRTGQQAPESAPPSAGRPAHPARPDPFRSFANYPTHRLTPATIVAAVEGRDPTEVLTLRQGPMVNYAEQALPTDVDCLAMLTRLHTHGAMSAGELVSTVPVERRGFALRGLAWLAKYDLVRLTPPAAAEGR